MNENGAFTTAITTKRTKALNASLRCRAFAGITVIEVAKSTRDSERWSPIEVFCNMSEPRCKHSTQALGQEKLRTVHALAGWFRVPDRGSGNPTPLGGMGSGQYRVRWLDGSVRARQSHGLGLEALCGSGDEVSVCGAGRGRCVESAPRADQSGFKP